MPSLPPVTRGLIVANIAVFVLQMLSPDQLLGSYALWPAGQHYFPELGRDVGFQPWQLITYAFLHGNYMHIFFNMFALYMFGRDVELGLGSQNFATLFAASILTAGIVQLIVVTSTIANGVYPTVGASGGAFGVMLAYGLMYPQRQLMLIFPPIPMRAWLFVTLYGIAELVQGVTGTASGVAHFAHLGGMLGAYLVLLRARRARFR
ncbi:MAG: rhomboid family intramembrane serine protease [Steroidobacteraceae bacterium]